MLHVRRNRRTKGLLKDATRAGSRVAEQAQQAFAGVAEETRGVAQTARTELGELSREGMTKARRRTARKLSKAADTVEPNGSSGGGKRKPLFKALFAGVAGWVLVNVVRKARHRADEAELATGPESEATEPESEATEPETAQAAETAKAKAEATETKAKQKAAGQPAERSTNKAKPAGNSGSTADTSAK